jgi:glycosyltransferase involved in cell wall biosynthesis
MTIQTRVAIVIPCHDDGEALLEAVRSALRQPGSEVVVVDDGSTDANTLAYLEEVRSVGVRVLRQANAGSAAARMAGVAATSAPYVQPLDADDRLVDGISGVMADYLDANHGVDVVWGNVQLVGERLHERVTARVLDPWLVTYLNDMPGPGSMVRRSVLLSVGGWAAPDPSRPNCYWDWHFWMSLAEGGHAGVNLGRVVFEYRVRAGSVNRQCSDAHSELYRQLRALHPQLYLDRRLHRRMSIVPFFGRVAFDAIELAPRISRRTRGRLQHAVCQVIFRRGGYIRGAKRFVRGWRAPDVPRRHSASDVGGGA